MKLVAIDPGFADLAYAVLYTTRVGEVRLLDLARIATKKETKKRKSHVGTDDGRRIDEIATALERAFKKHEPDLVGYELPAASKGARAGHALGMAHAIVRLSTRLYSPQMPLIEVTVNDARRAATGKRTGKVTEDEVHAAIGEQFGTGPGWIDQWSVHELDAIAVGLAALESSVARALIGRRVG